MRVAPAPGRPPVVAPLPIALAAVVAAGLAGCTAEPRYPIEGPGGRPSATQGWVSQVRPEYPIHPGEAPPDRVAEAAPPSPAAVAPTLAPATEDEAAPGPRVAAEPVEAESLAPPVTSPPLRETPAGSSAIPAAPSSAAPAYAPPSAEEERAYARALAHRRAAVAARAKALLPAKHEPATRTYTVAEGDTFYGMGRRFGVSPAEVARANDVKLTATLHPGMALDLPEDARDAKAQSGAAGKLVTTPGKAIAPTRAERAAALAKAEASEPRLQPPRPRLASAAPPSTELAAAAAPPRATTATPRATASLAPESGYGRRDGRAYPRPAPARAGDVAVPLARAPIPSLASSARPATAIPSLATPAPAPAAVARAEPPAASRLSREEDASAGLPSTPRPYASLGPQRGGRSIARSDGALPSSRSGGRTAADAQAAFQVAAARAAEHGEPAAAHPGAGVESGRGRFIWPVKGQVLSGFGPKGPGQRNDGVDIAAGQGDPVRAAASGEVVYAGHDVAALGNLVAIKHADGWVTIYGNLEKITVKPRDTVAQGGQVGLAGKTGAADRAQVHFEVRYAAQPADKARPIDPALVLPGGGGGAARSG